MKETQRDAINLLIIVALATIAYWPVFNAGFVYDDHALIEAMDAYKAFDVERMVLGLGNGLEYLPVRDITLALDTLIWGQNARGFHLSNFVWFMLLSGVLYRLVLLLAESLKAKAGARIAFVSTLIFVLHPLNTEAVAFITGRNNILALLFVLISTLFFMRGLAGRRGGFVLAVLAFILALFSKASAVFYPAALIMIYLCLVPFERHTRPAWVTMVLLLLVAVAVAVLHVVIAARTGISQPELARYGVDNIGAGLVRGSLVPAWYLRYFFFPWPQSISYDEVALMQWARGGLAIVLYTTHLALMLLAFRFRRQYPLVLVGLFWFFTSLVPVSNIFPTFPFVADRYLFPGSAGLALAVAAVLGLIEARSLRWSLLAFSVATLLFLTQARSQVWHSDLSLWEATWKVTPQTGAHAYFNALMEDGQFGQALALAAAENPRTYRYPLIVCESMLREARTGEALPACREALGLSAGFSSTVRQQINFVMAKVYEQAGEPLVALYHYLQVLQDQTATMRLYFLNKAELAVGRLRVQLRPQETALRESARIQTDNVRAQGEFGLFLLQTGRYEEAADRLERASGLQPDNWQISYNLGLAAVQSGDLERAHKAFQRVPQEVTAYAEGLNQLARQYSRRGDMDLALGYWQQAVAAQPSSTQYRFNLARHHLRTGSREQARRVLQEGLDGGLDSDRAFYRRAMENLGV